MAVGSDGNVIDALAPDAKSSNFPLPRLVTSFGPGGVFCSEGPVVNGQQMPGQWLLVGAKRIFGWEQRQASYMTGATLVPTGDPLLWVRYDVRIWNSGDAMIYRNLLKGLLKKPVVQISSTTGLVTTNAATAALGIDDPSLKDVGVTQVVVASVTPLYNPLKTSGGRGPWTAEVEFIEWRKPRAALAIPDQTIADPGPVTPAAVNMVAQEQANVQAGDKAREATLARQQLAH
jgi:hypothetical protein